MLLQAHASASSPMSYSRLIKFQKRIVSQTLASALGLSGDVGASSECDRCWHWWRHVLSTAGGVEGEEVDGVEPVQDGASVERWSV